MNRNKAVLSLIASVASLAQIGCASTQPESPALPTGQWEGSLVFGHPLVHNGEKLLSDLPVVIQNCGVGIQIFHARPDGTYIKDRVHTVVPHKQIVFLYSLAQSAVQPNGWLQSQMWTLVQVGPEALRMSYARTVVNPGEPADSPDRALEMFGFGVAKYKQECSSLPMAARQLDSPRGAPPPSPSASAPQ